MSSPTEEVKQFQRKKKSNKSCADCSAPGPTEVCVQTGTFVCSTCAGLLRSFGYRTKGVSMSSFNEKEAADIKSKGNLKVNKVFLHLHSEREYPLPGPRNAKMKEFLRLKYQEKRWMKGGPYDHGDGAGGAAGGSRRQSRSNIRAKPPAAAPAPVPAPAPAPAAQEAQSDRRTSVGRIAINVRGANRSARHSTSGKPSGIGRPSGGIRAPRRHPRAASVRASGASTLAALDPTSPAQTSPPQATPTQEWGEGFDDFDGDGEPAVKAASEEVDEDGFDDMFGEPAAATAVEGAAGTYDETPLEGAGDAAAKRNGGGGGDDDDDDDNDDDFAAFDAPAPAPAPAAAPPRVSRRPIAGPRQTARSRRTARSGSGSAGFAPAPVGSNAGGNDDDDWGDFDGFDGQPAPAPAAAQGGDGADDGFGFDGGAQDPFGATPSKPAPAQPAGGGDEDDWAAFDEPAEAGGAPDDFAPAPTPAEPSPSGISATALASLYAQAPPQPVQPPVQPSPQGGSGPGDVFSSAMAGLDLSGTPAPAAGGYPPSAGVTGGAPAASANPFDMFSPARPTGPGHAEVTPPRHHPQQQQQQQQQQGHHQAGQIMSPPDMFSQAGARARNYGPGDHVPSQPGDLVTHQAAAPAPAAPPKPDPFANIGSLTGIGGSGRRAPVPVPAPVPAPAAAPVPDMFGAPAASGAPAPAASDDLGDMFGAPAPAPAPAPTPAPAAEENPFDMF